MTANNNVTGRKKMAAKWQAASHPMPWQLHIEVIPVCGFKKQVTR
jgi:hypothetical protein